MHRKGRLRLVVRRSGSGPERDVALGRFGSAVFTVLLTVAAIAVLVVAFLFGYLLLGLLFAVFLIALVAALLRGVFERR